MDAVAVADLLADIRIALAEPLPDLADLCPPQADVGTQTAGRAEGMVADPVPAAVVVDAPRSPPPPPPPPPANITPPAPPPLTTTTIPARAAALARAAADWLADADAASGGAADARLLAVATAAVDGERG